MKKSLLYSALAFSLLGGLAIQGCYDPANQLVNNQNSGALDVEALRGKQVAFRETAQPLKNPGKIYVRDNFLYVNDRQDGLHIIDNTNAADPKQVGYVQIPGNLDVAMKGDALYADSYMDLLVIDMKTKKQERIKDVFTQFPDGTPLAQNIRPDGSLVRVGMQAVSSGGEGAGSSGSETGTGGSMSRFAIVGNTLYVLDGQNMKVFDVETPFAPKKLKEVKMDFVVETIFPYKDKLFIGGTQGMYVYDNTDPQAPQYLGQVEHVAACDPVVVQGDYAFVTLRTGTPCRGAAANELLVVNVKDPKAMKIEHTFPMHNPHGLAIRGNHLFVCDGNQGLKIYDASDRSQIINNMVFRDGELQKAYDVIAMDNSPIIIVVAKNGIFQYDAAEPKEAKRISQIKVGSES